MKDWLLTDKEIEALTRGSTLRLKPTSYLVLDPKPTMKLPALEDWIAKAQAQKIINWLEANFSQDSTNREYLISFDKWQELKKEIY